MKIRLETPPARWIVAMFMSLAIAILVVACEDQPTPLASTNTPIATHATSTPTGQLAAQSGPTTLGQPLSHFVVGYGQPTNEQNEVQYNFSNSTVTVQLPAKNQQIAMAIIYENADGNGWGSLEEATTACRAFLPPDAAYKRSLTTSQGEQERVYLAPSVASLFQASSFLDENTNPAPAGTVAIVYMPDSTNASRVLNCSIQIGVQG